MFSLKTLKSIRQVESRHNFHDVTLVLTWIRNFWIFIQRVIVLWNQRPGKINIYEWVHILSRFCNYLMIFTCSWDPVILNVEKELFVLINPSIFYDVPYTRASIRITLTNTISNPHHFALKLSRHYLKLIIEYH